ncbi:transposase, partial [Actinomyces sp.]|uniref:transposase n=1 Tax=Actinomyces sp. TaxID=29317 RepID=UPI00360E5429
RRMWLPKGQRTKLSVDRKKTSQSFFGALSLTSKKVKLYPIEGNQNTEQTILALERLQRETEAEKIAVVLDNARFHHAKALTGLYEPGRLLERITPIHLSPYAPDHNWRHDVATSGRITLPRTHVEAVEQPLED